VTLNSIKYQQEYIAIKELSIEKGYSISNLCSLLNINRSSYYKWLNRNKSKMEIKNEELLKLINQAYEDSNGILGYRQMKIKLLREYNIIVNHKRVYRLMKFAGIKSICRKKRKKYIKSTPETIADNILNRDFKAENIHEKWLTDVSEFKYGNGQKAYLSAILDLGDRSIVAYEIGKYNNNELVFSNFKSAVKSFPEASPLFHSDRGYQYTNQTFKNMLLNANMTQSMSRVGKCIDNGPMEGFFGIIKSEMYYLNKFETYNKLKTAIEDYIFFYNNKRYQKKLNCMTPIEFRENLVSKLA